jgi:hypothetical protein
MTLTIENPRLEIEGHYAVIKATINGVEATIPQEQRRRDDLGLIFLGPEFEELVPAAVVPPDPEQGRLLTTFLLGFTDDPEMLRIFDELIGPGDNGL